jgi:hypothetical protein
MKTVISFLILIWVTLVYILIGIKDNESKNYALQESQQIEKVSTESEYTIQHFKNKYIVRHHGGFLYAFDDSSEAENSIITWKEQDVFYDRADSAWRVSK